MQKQIITFKLILEFRCRAPITLWQSSSRKLWIYTEKSFLNENWENLFSQS